MQNDLQTPLIPPQVYQRDSANDIWRFIDGHKLAQLWVQHQYLSLIAPIIALVWYAVIIIGTAHYQLQITDYIDTKLQAKNCSVVHSEFTPDLSIMQSQCFSRF